MLSTGCSKKHSMLATLYNFTLKKAGHCSKISIAGLFITGRHEVIYESLSRLMHPHMLSYSTPNALNTASVGSLYGTSWNADIRSGGTVTSSIIVAAGRSTFFAPLSRHTCSVLARFSTFRIVPPILKSPSITMEL